MRYDEVFHALPGSVEISLYARVADCADWYSGT